VNFVICDIHVPVTRDDLSLFTQKSPKRVVHVTSNYFLDQDSCDRRSHPISGRYPFWIRQGESIAISLRDPRVGRS
jgi:hypothetical protein